MTKNAIIFNNLSISFHQKPVISRLSLSFKENRIAAILGRSGSGKSCLLKSVSGILPEEASILGEIKLLSRTIQYIDPGSQPLKQLISYMPQNHNLLPWLNTLENCLLSKQLVKNNHISDEISHARSLLDAIGLGQQLDYYPHQLSGGMQQRLALARTLIHNKPILLMDEPFCSLDAITRHEIHCLVRELLKNKTVVMVTHDPAEALYLADDIYLLKQGSLTPFNRDLFNRSQQIDALISQLADQEIAA